MLAQLVEHIPFKDGVLGSNPRQVTKKGRINLSVLFLIYAKSVNFKQNCPGAEIGRQAWLRAMYPYGCAGSSPVRGTNLTQSLYKSSDCVNKNLTATNLQQNEIPYKEAKLSDAGGDLSKRWHVYFSIWSDKEKKFKRKQEFISSKDYPTRAARTRFANELIALFNDGLRKGNITLPEYRKKSISRKNYSIEEGIEKSYQSEIEPLRDRMHKFMSFFENVTEKGYLEFVYSKEDVKTYVFINDKLTGEIEGLDFRKALFGIWLEDRCVDRTLKKRLLGK